MIEATEVVRRFRETAIKLYPEPVDEEVFYGFLTELLGTARLIYDANSFYVWVNEKEEVNRFIDLKPTLDVETYSVRGNRIGNYTVNIFSSGEKFEYVEIEWVPGFGYSYEETKIFKLSERPRGIPLGSVVGMLQSMGR